MRERSVRWFKSSSLEDLPVALEEMEARTTVGRVVVEIAPRS